MSFSIIGPSLKSVVGEKAEEYHHFVLAGSLIWAFSKAYHKQESFNWGQRVSHKGGYAIAFDTQENKWGEVQKFDAIHGDENAEEVIFELGGSVYLLILSNFGEVAFKKLFKWSSTKWEEVALQPPAVIPNEWKEARITATVVDDASSTTDRYIVVNMSSMHMFKLHTDGVSAVIEHVADVPEEANLLRGMCTSGINSGNRVIISFMVMGCGVRWEKNRFIIYDKETKEFTHVVLPDETSNNCPPFSFTGATGHGVSPNGEWIHAGGSVQVGMTGSQFEGSVWALKNLSGEPQWQHLPLVIPAEIGGDALIDSSSGEIYIIGGEGVGKAALPQ